MKRTLLMEAVRGETRLAVIEDDRLCEIYIDRPGSDAAAGSIYLGRVENVLPGMNAAFVDIGLEKNGFLSADDIPQEFRLEAGLANQLKGQRIEKLVRPGQEIMVQVTKAQSGQKGHRVSRQLTLPGRLMVLLPQVRYVGVSRKISNEAERARLRKIGFDLMNEAETGLILRTASEGATDADIIREFQSLTALWRDIEQKSRHAIAPKKLYDNDSLPMRCARDMLTEEVDAIWVEGEALFEEVQRQAETFAPQKANLVGLHAGNAPLFDLYKVDRQLEKALQKYVWLSSGGSLVIEETEAMTVIDVNTGKFTGRRDIEDTIFKLNREAAEEIVRQLRLRDIGGIVIVDFIDMADAAHNEALVEYLRELAKTDRNRLTVVGMTGLGLIELTRKKQRRPLSKQLMHTCSDCGGNGFVPSHETTARRAIREIWRRRGQGEKNPLLVETSEKAAGWMKTIGAPGEGDVYVHACAMKPGEYAIEPVDASMLPEGCRIISKTRHENED